MLQVLWSKGSIAELHHPKLYFHFVFKDWNSCDPGWRMALNSRSSSFTSKILGLLAFHFMMEKKSLWGRDPWARKEGRKKAQWGDSAGKDVSCWPHTPVVPRKEEERRHPTKLPSEFYICWVVRACHVSRFPLFLFIFPVLEIRYEASISSLSFSSHNHQIFLQRHKSQKIINKPAVDSEIKEKYMFGIHFVPP